MITADHAMEQAHMTANQYASYAKKSYEYLFDTEIGNDRQAAATFMAGFMQAASTDFAGWAIQRQLEGLGDGLTRIADISDEGFEDIVSLLSRLPVKE
jgi:hypothetical protein